jgi:hypothetical protein
MDKVIIVRKCKSCGENFLVHNEDDDICEECLLAEEVEMSIEDIVHQKMINVNPRMANFFIEGFHENLS